MSLDLSKVEVGSSVVVGIQTGISSKTNKPYTFFNIITRQQTNDGSINFKGDQVYIPGSNTFGVELFKCYVFLFTGNGNYKNLYQVVEQKIGDK